MPSLEDIPEQKPIRFIRLPEVLDRTGLGKTEIYARVKAATFPKPVPLSPARVAWVESEVTEWQKNIMRAAGRSI